MSKNIDITQEQMKNARTSGEYGEIWTSRNKCVFCDLKDKYIVAEENGVVLTTSLYPYIDGQLMAIPRRHIASPKELTSVEWETIRKFNYLAKKLVKKVHKHRGMWTLLREGGTTAGMSVVDHLHVHFIPFDNADLCHWNYRELAQTPIENATLYQEQAKYRDKLSGRYSAKYGDNSLKIIADAIIYRKPKSQTSYDQAEILIQKRAAGFEVDNSSYTLPGGHVDIEDDSILAGLNRELAEELKFPKYPDHYFNFNFELIYSEKEKLKYNNSASADSYIWNTYCADVDATKIDKNMQQAVQSSTEEASSVEWIPVEKVLELNITSGLRTRIKTFAMI